MQSSTPPVTGVGEVFSWTMEPEPGRNRTLVALRGEINENADFEPLKQRLSGDVILDLEGVTRVNSCGVREWVNFVRNLHSVSSLAFARCSPNVVLQLNTIYNFRGRARVVSFLAPYVCETCHVDEYKVLSVDEHFPDRKPTTPPPAFRCQRCGGVLVFDELPERYLSFLAEEAK